MIKGGGMVIIMGGGMVIGSIIEWVWGVKHMRKFKFCCLPFIYHY